MIITILAEPRSGSTNLANWFYYNKDFTVLCEPITNPTSEWYKNGMSPKLWEYNTPHFLVKETYVPNINFLELIEISDKVIILYRENITEQTESWLNATKTNNWGNEWVFKQELVKDEDTRYFNEIKIGIRDNYLNRGYFNISYEDLYYGNGFEKIVNYININEVKNNGFPVGKKYRLDKTNKLI